MKKINANNPEIKKIMSQFMRQFESVLEKYCAEDDEIAECGDTNEDELEECGETYESRNFRYERANVINEMAITRAVDSKALANVRDMVSRRNFDKNWATEVKPLPRLNDVELLNRYVAALLVFHAECPKNMDDVERIGIFKHYAEKMIDEGTITFEDIQKLYDKSPQLAVRPRTGTARAASGFRKNATKDFDFDAETSNVAAETPAPADEPESAIDDEPEVPAYDDVDVSTPDVEEPEIDDDDDDVLPDEVAAAIADETAEEAGDDEDASEGDGEIVEIDNINDLTVEDFDNPKMNASFHAHNDDNILLEDGKVGFLIEIRDEDGELLDTYKMLRESFGKALYDYTIAAQASVWAMSDTFYDLKITKVITVFYKLYNNLLSDDQQDELDKKINKFYYDVFHGSKDVNDIIKGLDEQAEEED